MRKFDIDLEPEAILVAEPRSATRNTGTSVEGRPPLNIAPDSQWRRRNAAIPSATHAGRPRLAGRSHGPPHEMLEGWIVGGGEVCRTAEIVDEELQY